MDNYWNDLIFSVCKGDVTQMKDLKTFEVFDFFSYIEGVMNKNKDNG